MTTTLNEFPQVIEDGRYVYLVRSEVNPNKWYRVDIVANGGFGECSCTDWATRRLPAIKLGEEMGPATMCKHVEKARDHFLNHLLPVLAEKEGEAQ